MEPLKGVPLPQPLRGFFEKLVTLAGNFASKIVGATLDNVIVSTADGDLKDGGVQISALARVAYVDSEINNLEANVQQWAAERFITEAEVPEAGTSEAATELVLTAPNGTQYQVTVSDAGALVITAI